MADASCFCYSCNALCPWRHLVWTMRLNPEETRMEILLALFWGAATGIILGLLGGGGAMLIIPVLLYVFNYTLSQSVGSSLFLVTLGALPAVLMYIRKNQVNWQAALPL